MARWGKCDFEQLKRFQKKLEKMSKVNIQKFCEDVSREIAARLLRKVIKRTPVGDYSKEVIVTAKKDGKKHKKGEKYTKRVNQSGKKGGTLRRGWTAKTEQEAKSGNSKGKDVSSWVNQLSVKKIGNIFQIDVTNVVSYSGYVEFRT